MNKDLLQGLNTETRNQNTLDIDSVNTLEILQKINNEDKTIAYKIEECLDDIKEVVDMVVDTFKNGGRLIYCGAGTSGRMGIIDAVECRPTFSCSDDMVIGLIAGGESAFIKAKEGAEDSTEDAINDAKKIGLNYKDILIGIAASGRTPYVLSMINYAKSVGAKTCAIANVKNSIIGQASDKKIEIITGAEVITGSTRMKAGTSQKLVCNMISTAAMIKIGKVYSNLMVDVKPTNEKLVVRACNIISEITREDFETSKKALEKYKTVKKACFALISGVEEIEKINEYLSKANDNLKEAINLWYKQ